MNDINQFNLFENDEKHPSVRLEDLEQRIKDNEINIAYLENVIINLTEQCLSRHIGLMNSKVNREEFDKKIMEISGK